MGRILKKDTDCADCLCRVCARNEDNDSWNHLCDYPNCKCDCDIGVHEVIETKSDCNKFLPDESDEF